MSRVERYVERFFQRHECTQFPTCRQVAKALRMRNADVMQEVEDNDNLQTTYWNVGWYERVPDGDRFIETLETP